MDEYIGREEAKQFFNLNFGGVSHAIIAARLLDEIPAADVAPVRHGRWIDAYPDIEPNPMFMYGICSECGFKQGISKYLKYCPDCGCRMDGVLVNEWS